MAAFSATFKLLKTKFFILATHCTNKSKSAEPRAEQQARLIAMPRRESFSASAKERRFLSISTTKLQRNTHVWKIVESEWRVKNEKWRVRGKKWTPKAKKWTPKAKKWNRKSQKVESQEPKSGEQKKRGMPLINEAYLV